MLPVAVAAHPIGEVQIDHPVAGLVLGVVMIAVGFFTWGSYSRFEWLFRRLPGNLGRWPTAIFSWLVGVVLVTAAIAAILQG